MIGFFYTEPFFFEGVMYHRRIIRLVESYVPSGIVHMTCNSVSYERTVGGVVESNTPLFDDIADNEVMRGMIERKVIFFKDILH